MILSALMALLPLPLPTTGMGLVPKPVSLTPGSGVFVLDEKTTIGADTASRPAAALLESLLRPTTHRALKIGALFMRTVENDLVAGDAVAARLFILETGDDFRDRAFLVKHAADRVEVIRFVRPRELHVGIAPAECVVRFAIFFAQRLFGENEERAAVIARERGDGDAVNLRATR